MTGQVVRLQPGTGEWPTQLDDLGRQCPESLFVKGGGQLRLLALRSVAVVGARAATRHGMAAADRLGGELAAAGWVVVSGAAHGIDTAAHRGALTAGGCSVAVVAGGIERDTPSRRMLAAVADQGAVVSEADGARPPQRHTFLQRNRLIAALTRATVVVEAAERSGALNTAGWAESLGRLVLAVPGPVTAAVSRGTHGLIRDGRAVLVRDTADVLELLEPIGAVSPQSQAPYRWVSG
jgi:DNA processing protein